MPQLLFHTSHVLTRAARAQAGAPVRAELSRRLTERLAEVKGNLTHTLTLTHADEIPHLPAAPYDAILADLTLPTINDIPVYLYRCLQALRPDGLLIATTLGAESFHEFRSAWAALGEPVGHTIPLTDVREAGSLLQKLKLALPVVDRDVLTLTFPDFPTLYTTMRQHGVGNVSAARRKGLTTPRQLAAMENAYRAQFARPDGRLPLTLEVLYLHGFTPAENQPKAAARGSGKVSLVRILSAPENPET